MRLEPVSMSRRVTLPRKASRDGVREGHVAGRVDQLVQDGRTGIGGESDAKGG
jgi:hypothetical protein